MTLKSLEENLKILGISRKFSIISAITALSKQLLLLPLTSEVLLPAQPENQ